VSDSQGAASFSSVASYDIRDRYAASGSGFCAFNYYGTWRKCTVPSLAIKHAVIVLDIGHRSAVYRPRSVQGLPV